MEIWLLIFTSVTFHAFDELGSRGFQFYWYFNFCKTEVFAS